MRESAVRFGRGQRLHGILTEPATGRPRQVLVLVNAGFVPKFGPHRVYGQLARTLVGGGVATLRFDLSGLGDSLPDGAAPLRDRTREEIRAAVDAVSARFPEAELVVGGVCSGAEDSLRHADVDARVRRMVLVDPFSYRTAGWGWRHALHRVGRRTLRTLGLWSPLSSADRANLVAYRYMERAESERILRALVVRGTAMHFIYTAGLRESFNHPDQLWKMFPSIPLSRVATVDFVSHLEHTQLLQEDRDTLIRLIGRRIAPPSAVDARHRG